MARDRNTYAKRQRETGKKQKAADKRARRLKRKGDAKGAEDSGDPGRVSSEQEPSNPVSLEQAQEVSGAT